MGVTNFDSIQAGSLAVGDQGMFDGDGSGFCFSPVFVRQTDTLGMAQEDVWKWLTALAPKVERNILARPFAQATTQFTQAATVSGSSTTTMTSQGYARLTVLNDAYLEEVAAYLGDGYDPAYCATYAAFTANPILGVPGIAFTSDVLHALNGGPTGYSATTRSWIALRRLDSTMLLQREYLDRAPVGRKVNVFACRTVVTTGSAPATQHNLFFSTGAFSLVEQADIATTNSNNGTGAGQYRDNEILYTGKTLKFVLGVRQTSAGSGWPDRGQVYVKLQSKVTVVPALGQQMEA